MPSGIFSHPWFVLEHATYFPKSWVFPSYVSITAFQLNSTLVGTYPLSFQSHAQSTRSFEERSVNSPERQEPALAGSGVCVGAVCSPRCPRRFPMSLSGPERERLRTPPCPCVPPRWWCRKCGLPAPWPQLGRTQGRAAGLLRGADPGIVMRRLAHDLLAFQCSSVKKALVTLALF